MPEHDTQAEQPFDPDAIEAPEPYTDAEWETAMGADDTHGDGFIAAYVREHLS